MLIRRLSTSTFVLVFLHMLAQPALSDSDRYFESQDSNVFDKDKNFSNNRNGDNPVIVVKRFDISALKSMPEYGINAEDLEEIIQADQKKNKNRYDIDRLNQLAGMLTAYYKNKGLILARVYLPPQHRQQYTLKFNVILGEIEKVNTKNHDYYSETRLQRPFQDLINKPAYVPTLESSLIELKEYPGVELSTRFTEGDSVGKTQVDIFVKKEQATDFSFAFDNYGSEYTGLYRATLTGDFFNVADQADHLNINLLATIDPMNSLYAGMSYRFKIAPYFQHSHLGNRIFRHGLNMTVGHQQSQFSVGGEFEDLNIKGEAKTTTIGIDKDLLLRNRYRLNTGLSINKKIATTSNDGNQTKEDRLSVLTWTTYYRWNDFLGTAAANIIKVDIHNGLPGFAGSMKNGDENTRVEDDGYAPLDFVKYNLTYNRNQQMGVNWLLFSLRHQETSDLLTVSEQVNLGGPTAIRGYAASDFSADKATHITMEYSGHSNARKYSIPISHLKLAGFIDHGLGRRLKPQPNEVAFTHMTSIGGYAQFVKKKKFSTKFEVAIPLSEVEGTEGQDFEVLFSMQRGF